MRALVAAKKADLVPCIFILPYVAGYCTSFSFIVVQECNLHEVSCPKPDGKKLAELDALGEQGSKVQQ